MSQDPARRLFTGAWRLALCAIKLARQNFPLDFFSEMVYSTLDGFQI